MTLKKIVGKKFGNWFVVRRSTNRGHHTRVLCRCICGTERVRTTSNVIGRSLNTGCGCVSSRGTKPFETLYKLLRETAKSRGGRLTCSLTYTQFLRFTKIADCHYCGAALNWKPYYSNSSGYKLDRKNNKLGYTIRNCVVCCARCNRGKGSDFTYTEWVQIGRLIRDMRTA